MIESQLEAIRIRNERADYVHSAKWGEEPVDVQSDIENLIAECKRLRSLLRSADELIEDLGRCSDVVDTIPGCRVHGQGCIPWAMEWVAKMRYATVPIPFERPCHFEGEP